MDFETQSTFSFTDHFLRREKLYVELDAEQKRKYGDIYCEEKTRRSFFEDFIQFNQVLVPGAI